MAINVLMGQKWGGVPRSQFMMARVGTRLFLEVVVFYVGFFLMGAWSGSEGWSFNVGPLSGESFQWQNSDSHPPKLWPLESSGIRQRGGPTLEEWHTSPFGCEFIIALLQQGLEDTFPKITVSTTPSEGAKPLSKQLLLVESNIF